MSDKALDKGSTTLTQESPEIKCCSECVAPVACFCDCRYECNSSIYNIMRQGKDINVSINWTSNFECHYRARRKY